MCTLPPVSFQTSQVSTVPNRISPRSAFSRAPATWSSSHLIFVRGKIGIRCADPVVSADKPGTRRALRAALSAMSAVRRHCQTMALWMGSSGRSIPKDRRLALVGDADARHIGRRNIGGRQHLEHSCILRGPDFHRVLLDPSLVRIMLRSAHAAVMAQNILFAVK